MIKIKNIDITGIRGIKKSINLTFDDSRSLMLYGDNGSGKSSISDALEWFFYDRVEHLSTGEIGKSWVEALRNITLNAAEDACVDIKFSDSKYDSKRILTAKGKKEYPNNDQDFKDYLLASKKERLILRYKDLLKFILYTKADKLKEISDIIGYEEVTKIKNTLKKASSDIAKEIKTSNIKDQKSDKQNLFLREAGGNIYDDSQYFKTIKQIISPLKLSIDVNSHDKIKEVSKFLQTADNKEAISLIVSYDKLATDLPSLITAAETIKEAYKNYYEGYFKIVKDIEKTNKIQLEGLLVEGLSLLEKKNYMDDKCPLCLQAKKREELIGELRDRITELSAIKKDKQKLDEDKETVQKRLRNTENMIDSLLREKTIDLNARKYLDSVRKNIAELSDELKKQVLAKEPEILKPEDIVIADEKPLLNIISDISDKNKKLKEQNKDDLRVKISSKIAVIGQAYSDYCILKKKEDILIQQQRSMELISEHFIKKQKEALNAFLAAISKDMNDYYLYMNKSEAVDEIELIPMGEGDELIGITIQYKFHGKIVTPPDKYLSESHLNCLGIALFLSSVKIFNKKNSFFVLDDVISSFDRPHRIEFARLLLEKFKDYQILLFTHEQDWFEILAGMVKPHKWIIKRVFWTETNGTEIEMVLPELRERIEDKIKKSDKDDLGNMIRKYLERLLKEISYNLEVKVKFLFNDSNEKRMPGEMISEIKSKLNHRKCEIKDNPIIEKLKQSAILGNWTSHDSRYTEDINDLKTFYRDILQFESIFRCKDCGQYISTLNLDTVNELIRCSCGNLEYDWKE